jgi:allantoin racemase
MKLAVLTPVHITTGCIETETAAYAGQFLRSDTALEFISLSKGHPCIESETHALIKGPETLALAMEAEKKGADGVFVNCFDDPSVFACRECMSIPVFGGYIPTVLTALGLAERIGIITTDIPGILSEERKARLLGVSGRISIRSADMSVLALMAEKKKLVAALKEICIEMYEKDRIGAACLGCTGMAYAVDDLREALNKSGCPITIVEPVAAALTWLERTVILGNTNSLGTLNSTER